jgi:uncharacterized membrane protein
MTTAPRESPPGGTGDHRHVLAAIVALATILRLFRLGHQSLWVDEIMTLIVATPKPGYSIWRLIRHNIHGPLHTFVVYLMQLAGTGDAWLRLPSAIAGIASVPLLYAWVRPRLGDRPALWSALLLAVNPLHIHYSQELRNYAFVVFFVLAGCVAIDRACRRWSVSIAIGAGACVAAAVLSNFSAVFSFAAQSLTFFQRGGVTRRSAKRWLAIAAVAVAIASPWIYRVTTYVDFGRLATPVLPGELDESQRLRGTTTFSPEAIPYAAYAYSVGFSLGPSLRDLHQDATLAGVVSRHGAVIAWVCVLFGALAAWSAWMLARTGRAATLWELASYIVIPLGATLLLNWQNAKAFNVRYVIVGLPMYLAIVAYGAASLPVRLGRIALALVLATSAWSLAHFYADPAYAKEDVRDAVRAVETRMRPGECVFAPTVWQIVQHYQTGGEPLHFVYGDNPVAMRREMQDLFDGCPSFWYIRARPWVDDPDGRVLSAIEARCRATDTLRYPGVTVTRYEVLESSP